MKKKLLSLVMALVMCLGLCVPALASAGQDIPSYEEAFTMCTLNWDMGVEQKELHVSEALDVRKADGEPIDMTGSGYYKAASDVTLIASNASNRSDCLLFAATMYFKNDGSGAFYQVEDVGGFVMDGEDLLSCPSGSSIVLRPELPMQDGDDVLMVVMFYVGFSVADGDPVLYDMICMFRLGAAEKVSKDAPADAGTPSEEETPDEPETPETSAKPAAPAFTDVPASAYYAAPVAWAVEKEITTGTSATTFSPAQDCTNAQILTFLWRACGKPEVKADRPFTNSVSDAYVQAILWAYTQEMVTGTTFDTSVPCTRAMAVTYIWQACGSPEPETAASFTDVPAGADYAQAVAWAVEQGVTTGTSDTTFSPDAVCNRGQIVTFLHRAMG